MAINENTPIAMMTAKQLKEYLFGDGEASVTTAKQSDKKEQNSERRYLYSVKQLAEFLKVSYTTAWKYKDTILKAAVYQQGRTILIDIEKVLNIMGNNG